MKNILFAVTAVMSVFSAVAGGLADRTEARIFTGADGKVFRYRWAEKAAPAGEKVPLVLFLHGAGERGSDNAAQLKHGVGDLVKWLDRHEKGFRLIAGQVPVNQRWVEVDWNAPRHATPAEPSETMGLAFQLLDQQLADTAVDASRVYVTGISMGGYGTWDAIIRRPDTFAAAMPICGGGDETQAPKIAKLPIWTFHGSKDGAVPVARTRNMLRALWAAGSDAHYREYPDMNHDVWTRTYRDPEVLGWFFSQRRAVAK